MYLISDLIRITGLSRETLNYYYNKGLFKEVNRMGESGYRIFNDETIKHLQYIIKLRKEGKSIKEIKEILKD